MTTIERDPRYDVLLADVVEASHADNWEASPTLYVSQLYNDDGDAIVSVQQEIAVERRVTVASVSFLVNDAPYASDISYEFWLCRGFAEGDESADMVGILADRSGTLTGSATWTSLTIPLDVVLSPGTYYMVLRCEVPFVAEIEELQVAITEEATGAGAFYAAAVDTTSALASFWERRKETLVYAITTVEGGVASETTFPLLLLEGGNNGALGFNVGLSSPFGGKLSQGDVKEADLTAYSVRTQSDWRGGRGQETAYGPTDRYSDGLMDTRFSNMAVLPPLPVPTQGEDPGPSYMPNDASSWGNQLVRASRGTISAETPEYQPSTSDDSDTQPNEVYGKYGASTAIVLAELPGDDVDTEDVYVKYDVTGEPEYGIDNYSPPDYLTCGAGQTVGQAFTAIDGTTLTSISFITRTFDGAGTYAAIYLVPDENGAPKAGTDKNYHYLDYMARFAVSPGTSLLLTDHSDYRKYTVTYESGNNNLTAGVKYWIVWVVYYGIGRMGMGMTHTDRPAYIEPVKTRDDRTLTWGTAVANRQGVPGILHFELNSGTTATNKQTRQLAQPFAVGASGIAISALGFKAQRTIWQGSPTLQAEIQGDSSGVPDGSAVAGTTVTIARADLDAGALAPAFIRKRLTAAVSLAEGTYWLVLRADASSGTDQCTISWQGNMQSATSAEWAAEKAGAGAWDVLDNTAPAGTGKALYSYIENSVIARRRLSQAFTIGDASVAVTKVRLLLKRQARADTGGTVRIETDDSGEPSGTLATGTTASVSLAASAIPESRNRYDWVDVEGFDLTLSASTKYHLVFDMSAGSTAATVNSVLWYGDDKAGYADNAAYESLWDADAGDWDVWDSIGKDLYFMVNNGHNPQDSGMTARRLAQSFVVPVGGITLTRVGVLLRKIEHQGAPTLTLKVVTDSTGVPSTTVKTTQAITLSDLQLNGQREWHNKSVDPGVALAAGTYWIVLEPGTTAVGDKLGVEWYHDWNVVADSDSAHDNYADGAWAGWSTFASVETRFYIINNGKALGTASVSSNFCRFDGDWWVGAGDTVYQWDTTTSEWQDAETFTGYTVKSLAVFAGSLYVAMTDDTDGSSGQVYASADGITFTGVEDDDTNDVDGSILRTWGGYLYVGDGAAATVRAFSTAWDDAVTVGTDESPITALIGYAVAGSRNEIIAAKTVGLWLVGPAAAEQVVDYLGQEADTNGAGTLAWVGDRRLYVPVRNSLLAWDGAQITPAGLDVDEGLPNGDQGSVVAMVGLPQWLLAAVDAGASGRSGIYARSTTGGWHCLVKAEAGKRIASMGFEAVTEANGVPRLWWNEGATIYYAELPETTDNRYAYTGSLYRDEGYLVSSWWGGELSGIIKHFQSIVIRSEGCGTDAWLEVYYEIDRSGQWISAGEVRQNRLQEIVLEASAVGLKATSAECTAQVIRLDAAYTTIDLSAGQFVRIGDDVGQIDSVDSISQFTLVLPLPSAPEEGTAIYPSQPAGYEIRTKIVAKTADSSVTPRILSVSARYMEQILDKARITLNVRVEDGMQDRIGGMYPYDSATLRAKLLQYARRPTPFTMIGPDGLNWRVKIVNATDSGYVRQYDALRQPLVRSVMTLDVMEV